MSEGEERIRYSDITTVEGWPRLQGLNPAISPAGTHPSLIPAENLAPLGRERELRPFVCKLQPAFSIDLVKAPSRLLATGRRLPEKLLSGGGHLIVVRQLPG